MIERIARRKVLTLLGGAAASPLLSPLAARAQQRDRVRRVGVLMTLAADDSHGQARFTAFQQEMQQLGWADGRNVRIETRWAAGSAHEIRKHAAELAALAPDVILTNASPPVAALLQATRVTPIVFTGVVDPVGAGFVDSLARPGGNATGFLLFEYGLGGKWIELIKELVPGLTRVAVVRDSTSASGIGQFGAIQAVASPFRIELSPLGMSDAPEIERAIVGFAHAPNGGLIVTASTSAVIHRELILSLASRHKLPVVYYDRVFVTAGGLISYGPDRVDQFRRAAGYVDRILKGAKPADLPVQAPTKYETVLNLKTAKALGLPVPDIVLVRADEVIE